MTKHLTIYVEFEEDDDFDYLRQSCVYAVQNVVDEASESDKLDGEVTVDWDVEDR